MVTKITRGDISRIIEMSWEDRTPLEAIEHQFGLNEAAVIRLMRAELSRPAFKRWRARVNGRKTKHLQLRSGDVSRHQSSTHNKVNR